MTEPAAWPDALYIIGVSLSTPAGNTHLHSFDVVAPNLADALRQATLRPFADWWPEEFPND